jgi:hypothetical protein
MISRRYFWIRLRIFLRHLRVGAALVFAWFAFGTFGFVHWGGLGAGEALRNALYVGWNRGPFWDLYSFWGQCVLFGIVIGVVVLQGIARYRPEEGCRMLANEMKDHAVIVGYTHLGELIVEELRAKHKPYVVIEKDEQLVNHLIRDGEPVILDNAREPSTLKEAAVERARLIVIASNNVETALMVTKRARELNKSAKIIVRCYHDDFTEVLESLGADRVISSSKSAFHELAPTLLA